MVAAPAAVVDGSDGLRRSVLAGGCGGVGGRGSSLSRRADCCALARSGVGWCRRSGAERVREGNGELVSVLAGVAAEPAVRAVEPLLRANFRSGGFWRLPRNEREREMIIVGSCVFPMGGPGCEAAGASATASKHCQRVSWPSASYIAPIAMLRK